MKFLNSVSKFSNRLPSVTMVVTHFASCDIWISMIDIPHMYTRISDRVHSMLGR